MRWTTVAVIAPFVALALAAPPARAQAVRVAVVGFESSEKPETMRALSGALRTELAAALERGTFEVVTREEMGAVYSRHGACVAADTHCIVEASAEWNGRLFVRGKTTTDQAGVRVDVTLESVRGLMIAKAAATAPSADSLAASAGLLAKALAASEVTFRSTKQTVDAGVVNAPAAAGAPAAEVKPCVGQAVLGTAFVDGSIAADASGVRFVDKNGVDATQKLKWSAVKELRSTDYNKRPALHVLTSSSKDDLLVTFATAALRDQCATATKLYADVAKKH